MARRLEELYFAPGFAHFATKGGKRKESAHWYRYKMGPDRIGWFFSKRTNSEVHHHFDLTEHLRTPVYYGTCLDDKTGTRFAALDFDDLSNPDERTQLRECIEHARRLGLTPHLVYSGNNLQLGHHLGAHLELFFDEVVSIRDACRLLDHLTGGRHDQPGTCYPEALPTASGKAYRLPFAVHKTTGNLAVFVIPDTYELIAKQDDYVNSIAQNSFPYKLSASKLSRRVADAQSTPVHGHYSCPKALTPHPTPPHTSYVADFNAHLSSSAYSYGQLERWLNEGCCPKHKSFSVAEALAQMCAVHWHLPRGLAENLLMEWTARLPQTNHSTSEEQRKTEIGWLLTMAYTPSTRGAARQQLMDEWAHGKAKTEAKRMVMEHQELLDRLRNSEPRPECTRKAIIDVLSVFVAAESSIADVTGTFYLSQRMIGSTLGSGSHRVNRVIPYITLREQPWGENPLCSGYFYRQVTYHAWYTKIAPSYQRISKP